MKAVTRRNENIPFGESEFVTDLVYGSYLRVVDQLHGLDSTTRDISYAQELLNALGIQADRWPRATVPGSKGKGSVSVLLASILAASGEHVGLVTSPHMRSFTERIRIDGRCVSNEELEEAAHQIAPAVHSITDRIPPLRYLGPGGVILALAYSIFAKHKVTAVVIEAGRGGEYDEARLVKANVSVLTPIMLEHPDKLGPTVKDIVITKTRITAPGSTIISSPQSPIVRAMMQQTATEIGSEVKEAGKDILIKKQRHQDLGVVCDLQLTNIVYSNLYINLGGLHQTENAATAILAAQALSTYEVKCTREGIYAGFKNVHWPGRAQFLQQNPWVFLDGAINRESAKYACDVVSQY